MPSFVRAVLCVCGLDLAIVGTIAITVFMVCLMRDLWEDK